MIEAIYDQARYPWSLEDQGSKSTRNLKRAKIHSKLFDVLLFKSYYNKRRLLHNFK